MTTLWWLHELVLALAHTLLASDPFVSLLCTVKESATHSLSVMFLCFTAEKDAWPIPRTRAGSDAPLSVLGRL